MSVIPEPERQKQEKLQVQGWPGLDSEFQASQGFITRLWKKKKGRREKKRGEEKEEKKKTKKKEKKEYEVQSLVSTTRWSRI